MISKEKFLRLSSDYNLLPIYEKLITDTETPVSLYRRLSHLNDYSFLLESANVSYKTNLGRYSFIGISPEKIIKNTDEGIIVTNSKNTIEYVDRDKDLIEFLDNYLDNLNVYKIEDLPPFSGGLVGYFGYEMINEWEEIYHTNPGQKINSSNLPSSILVLAKLVIVYDHLNNTLKIIDNIEINKGLTENEKIELYYQSKEKIQEIIKIIKEKNYIAPEMNMKTETEELTTSTLTSNTGENEFAAMVRKGKEYIKAGEVFQLVLSQKFSVETKLSPFQVYRALRVSNPSPYLFYLNFPEVKLIGSSPEILIKVKNDKVITRPLAGTRPRGKSRKEDFELEKDLLADEKEQAEHIMLVDLGRNDLGRVCKFNTIEVTELMGVEHYSQVMHLVSQVEGIKKSELSSLDVLRSAFPAGTVSGAPKIRAMELIDRLEKEPRGIYAGAVGYLDFAGNLDTCITIRTFSVQNNTLSVQVGAGIVADSIPEKEYQETLNKANALFQALEITKKEEPYGLSN